MFEALVEKLRRFFKGCSSNDVRNAGDFLVYRNLKILIKFYETEKKTFSNISEEWLNLQEDTLIGLYANTIESGYSLLLSKKNISLLNSLVEKRIPEIDRVAFYPEKKPHTEKEILRQMELRIDYFHIAWNSLNSTIGTYWL